MFEGWEDERVPEAVSDYEKTNWREPRQFTLGEKILDTVDPERSILEINQQKKILRIKSEEALSAFLHFNLGENALPPDVLTASEVFGRLVETKIQISQLIAGYRIYSVAQAILVLHESRTLAANKNLTRKERIDANRACTEALRTLSMLVERAERFFIKQRLLEVPKRDRSKKKVVTTPAKSAPDFG